MKFTFRTEKPTGKYRSFDKRYYIIKLEGADVGTIDSEHPYKIRLMGIKDDPMEDGNPNCKWRWKSIHKEFNSVDEAKVFLNDNIKQILDKINIHIQK